MDGEGTGFEAEGITADQVDEGMPSHTEAERDLLERRAEEDRPVSEAGGGEAEGFEDAEAALIENAEQGEGGTPRDDDLGGAPRTAEEPAEESFGEADHAGSQGE